MKRKTNPKTRVQSFRIEKSEENAIAIVIDVCDTYADVLRRNQSPQPGEPLNRPPTPSELATGLGELLCTLAPLPPPEPDPASKTAAESEVGHD